MLKVLQDLFKITPDKESKDQQLDVKLAAATLMFELIRSDGTVEQIELFQMRELLIKQFNLDDDELNSLFQLAERNVKAAISMHAFTREICEHWGNSKRAELLENLWLLALSDDVIDRHERHFVRKVSSLLHLNENELIQCRERAKLRLGIIAKG